MSPFLINSLEKAAPFNVVSHTQATVLLACYQERITQILQFRVRQTVQSFSKFLRCLVGCSVLSTRNLGRCPCAVEVLEL